MTATQSGEMSMKDLLVSKTTLESLGRCFDFPYDLRAASRRSVLSTLQEDYIGFRFVRVKRGQ